MTPLDDPADAAPDLPQDLPRVLVAGEALIDVVERAGRAPVELPGGSCANVALALGRLGRRPRLATALGEDDRGDRLRRWLADSDVELAVVVPPGGGTSTARAVLDEHGAARYEFDLSWALPPVGDDPCDVLHVGSIASVLEPGARDVRDLVRRRRRHALVSLDPNARPAITPDVDSARERVEELVALSDLVKVSDEDLGWYFPGIPAANAAARWARLGPALVVVTRGGSGATVVRADGTRLDVPGKAVEVVDTIAAGDTFTAGLLDALLTLGIHGADAYARLTALDDATVEAVVRHAHAAAAVTVSRPGADPPRRADLPEVGR
ncbi:fructokinase [Nocardioides sp. J9]|uniref:PfkB family carbohydrate kinase n=1 Tax=unclassified Nocardioides TaxID=2615069 RepID=UPI0004B669B6|nr:MULTISPECIES: PfkB family carbohydrate kinase [unclassified Nocardioides]TWH00824.1 fructokinase [Nocardioides sp. J9]